VVGVDYRLTSVQAKKGKVVSKMGRGRRGARISMTGWDPELITPDQMKMAEPLLNVARLAYALIKRSIFTEGKSGDKPFGLYSDKRPPAKGHRHGQGKPGHRIGPDGKLIEEGVGYVWVSPKRPQPAGFEFRVQSGPMKGWAAYKSSRAYAEAQGKTKVTLYNTGTLAQGMQIRPLGPTKARISFYGGSRKTRDPGLGGTSGSRRRTSQPKNNSDLARILGNKWGFLLELSADDMRKIDDVVAVLFFPALFDMLRLAQIEVSARKSLRARNRRLKTIKAQFEAAKQGARG